MASVVIIHAADDTLPARALAEKLRQAKLSVIIERQPGDQLREALQSAPVAIALWSPRSVGVAELVEEAKFAKGKTKLVHATMQSAAAPEPFRSDETVNLTGWRGEDDFASWRQLADSVTKKAGVAPLPPPAPRPPSGFFQPGVPQGAAAPAPQATPQQARQQQQAPRQAPQPAAQQQRAQPAPRPQPTPQPRQQAAPPPPRAEAASGEKKGGGMGMIIGIIALVVIVLGGGGAYWFMTQNNAAQTTAFEDVDLGSASAIREFLATNPSDEEREQARQALAELEQQQLDAARDANTIEAFEAFLRDFPDSSEAIFVQGQIAQLRLQEGDPNATTTLPPDGATTTDGATAPNPDLVPPGTTAPTTPGAGPAVIAPPASEPPAGEPGTAPTP